MSAINPLTTVTHPAPISLTPDQTTNKRSLFRPISAFHNALKDPIYKDGEFNCLAVAKKVLYIALPIIILVNLVLLPLFALADCCFAQKGLQTPAPSHPKSTPKDPTPLATGSTASTTTISSTSTSEQGGKDGQPTAQVLITPTSTTDHTNSASTATSTSGNASDTTSTGDQQALLPFPTPVPTDPTQTATASAVNNGSTPAPVDEQPALILSPTVTVDINPAPISIAGSKDILEGPIQQKMDSEPVSIPTTHPTNSETETKAPGFFEKFRARFRTKPSGDFSSIQGNFDAAAKKIQKLNEPKKPNPVISFFKKLTEKPKTLPKPNEDFDIPPLVLTGDSLDEYDNDLQDVLIEQDFEKLEETEDALKK